MQPFTFKLLLTKKDLRNAYLAKYFKSLAIKIFFGISIFTMIGTLPMFIHKSHFKGDLAPMLCFSIMMLLSPLWIIRSADKNYNSNSKLKHERSITIDEQSVAIKGYNFEVIYSWDEIHKFEETREYILVYITYRVVQFIPKKLLTTEQIDFIKGKIG